MDCAAANNILSSRLSSTWILDLRTGEYREAYYKPTDIEQQTGDSYRRIKGYYLLPNPPKSEAELNENIAILAAIYKGEIYSCGAHTVDEVLQPTWLFQSMVSKYGLLKTDPTPLLWSLDPADKHTLVTTAIKALSTVPDDSSVPVGIAYVILSSSVFDLAAWGWMWSWAKGRRGRAPIRTRVFAMKALQAMIRRGQPFTTAIAADVDALQQAADDFGAMFPTYGPADVQEKALYASEGSSLAGLVNQILAERALSPGIPTFPGMPTQITVPGIPPGYQPPAQGLPPWVLPIGGSALAVSSLLGLVLLTRKKRASAR